MDIPVLCLDTCVVLDILRDPTRKDVRVHEHEASLALLSTAQSGTALEILVAEQVSREFRNNVEQVQQDARRSIGALTRQIGKLNTLVALYGKLRPMDLGHWKDHDQRSRNAAERWLQVGTTVRQTSNTVPNAFLRLNQARSVTCVTAMGTARSANRRTRVIQVTDAVAGKVRNRAGLGYLRAGPRADTMQLQATPVRTRHAEPV